MQMLYLLAFGNPYINEDSLAITIADSIIKDKIKGLEVVKCISPEEVINYTDKDFYILDVVKDLEEVMIIDDIDRLKGEGMVSLHDFDLGFFLKLMKKTGKLDKVNIIGIPQQGDIKSIKEKVLDVLSLGKEEGDKKENKEEREKHSEFMLLGVGNSMRCDDGIGSYIANRFKDNDWQILDCSTVPENFTSVVRKAGPKTVIIVDSAEMKLNPGEFRIINKEKLGKLRMTTHAMPLSVLITYIEEFVPKVIFIGIQPKIIQTGTEISPELESAAEQVINILKKKDFSKVKVLD
jgi:hydrogenase 3 maturation protease